MSKRTMVGLAVVVAAVALTACNPLPNQPAAGFPDGRSRSGFVRYEGPPGWLEVAVSASPVDDVSFDVFGIDWTRPIRPEGMSCYFGVSAVDGWQDGASLGYQRVERIGNGTELKVQFPVHDDGFRFDIRVVDDAGMPVGDLTHQVPDGRFESVAGPICA